MRTKSHSFLRFSFLTALGAFTALSLPTLILAAEEEAAEVYTPSMYATFWALVPPIIAIALALITKGTRAVI